MGNQKGYGLLQLILQGNVCSMFSRGHSEEEEISVKLFHWKLAMHYYIVCKIACMFYRKKRAILETEKLWWLLLRSSSAFLFFSF